MKTFSRLSAGVFLFYLGIALVITFPLMLNLSNGLIGHDTSDAYEMGHHIWWFKYALQTGQPLFYQTLLAYPDGITGVSLWSNPLQFFPAWLFAFVMPVAAAYNVTILLTMALNGWAMWWVMWHLLHNQGEARALLPALVAGVIYMAYPTMQGHLFGGHAGLLVAWGVPLYVYALFKVTAAPSRRWFILAVIYFLISVSGHTLQAIYVLLPITGLFVLARLYQRDWRGAGRVVLINLVATVLLALFLIPVVQDTFATDTYTGDGGYVEYSLDLLTPITPSFMHPFFGQFEYTRRVLGINLIEGSAYIGIAAGMLAVIAVVTQSRSRWWLLLGVVALVLGFGPLLKVFDTPLRLSVDGYETNVTLPWAFLYHFPGFSLARTPGRFAFTLALAVAALAGYGMAYLQRRLNRAAVPLTALLIGFALWEYQAAWSFPTVPAAVPEAVTALRERDEVRAVMDVPWGNLLAAKDGLYLQTWHEQPLVAGQVTRRTPVSPAKLTLLERRLDPALLDAAGVDVIILHKTRLSPDDQRTGERLRRRLGEPYYEDERLALFNVPDTETLPETQTLLANDETLSERQEHYLYAAEPGWIALTGTLTSEGQAIGVYLDDTRVHRLTAPGDFTIPLPITERGYYTVALVAEPPCPRGYRAPLLCPAPQVIDVALTPTVENPTFEPVSLANGVRLEGAHVGSAVNDTLAVNLWWSFREDLPVNNVRRFVHLIDENGEVAAQADDTPPNAAAGESLTEAVTVDLSGLEGTYEVYTGWYTLPEVVNFTVEGDVPGAEAGRVYLDEVVVR